MHLVNYLTTGNQPLKSICRLLGPRSKKPTLGVQQAIAAGNKKQCFFLRTALLFTVRNFFKVTKPLTQKTTTNRTRRIYKQGLVIVSLNSFDYRHWSQVFGNLLQIDPLFYVFSCF